MTKFKVGDKVKILNGRNSAAYSKGMEGIVTANRTNYSLKPIFRVELTDGDVWSYWEEELELTEEKKEFKTGDLVKVLKSDHGAPEGTIGRHGIIRSTDGVPSYCVEFNNGEPPFVFHNEKRRYTEQWWYAEDELELVVSPEKVDRCSMYPSTFSDLKPTNKEETTMTNEIKEGQRVIHERDGVYIDTSEGLLVDMVDTDGTTKVESIATGEKEWVNTKDLRPAEIQVGDFVEVSEDHHRFQTGDVYEVIEVEKDDFLGLEYKVKTEDSIGWVHKDKVKLTSLWHEVEREENIGSENGTLIVEQNYKTKELRITRGCFKKKTFAEFDEAVRRKPEGDPHRAVYEFLIKKYKEKYPQPVEKKYYVKLSDELAEQIGNGGIYLNVLSLNDKHSFGTPTEAGSYVTQFTRIAAEEWVEKLDKLELEIVEVEEEPQW